MYLLDQHSTNIHAFVGQILDQHSVNKKTCWPADYMDKELRWRNIAPTRFATRVPLCTYTLQNLCFPNVEPTNPQCWEQLDVFYWSKMHRAVHSTEGKIFWSIDFLNYCIVCYPKRSYVSKCGIKLVNMIFIKKYNIMKFKSIFIEFFNTCTVLN